MALEAAAVIVSAMLAAVSLWGVVKAMREQSLASDARLIAKLEKQVEKLEKEKEKLEKENDTLRAQLSAERGRRGRTRPAASEERL